MATFQQIIERIQTRLFLVAGLDTQIHAEDQMLEMLRGVYVDNFEDIWYQDFTYHMTGTLNGTTGEIIEDLSTTVLKYADINTVYWDEDERPLPRVTVGTSVDRIRTRSVMPSGDPKSVFKLYPSDTNGQVHIWYRKRIPDSAWDLQQFNEEVHLDDQVLILGVVYEFLVNDGSNPDATQEYKQKYLLRQSKIRKEQFAQGISKRPLERDGPATRWE